MSVTSTPIVHFDGSPSATVVPDDDVILPHECVRQGPPLPTRRTVRQRTSRRLTGIDVARATALVGMMAVHILPEVDANGGRPVPFVLAAGNAAALFAVLAGVGVGLTTGRDIPPSGRRWTSAVVGLFVRAVFIGTVGLVLGFVSAETALVILPYYGLLFLMMIPILRNPAWVNFTVGVLVAVIGPLASHAMRTTTAALADPPNLTFGDVLTQPQQTLTTLFLTGAFPAIGWFSYVCIGLGIGRMRLHGRRADITLIVMGFSLAVLANASSWLLLNAAGGRTALASVASKTMTLEQFTDALVWGASGTLPTDSWWWLAVLAPHTTTPVDLLYSTGIAVLVLGACLALGRVIPDLLRPIATFGSMPLSMYAGHLLLLEASSVMPTDATAEYLLQLALLFVFAQAWRSRFDKGPLEMLMGVFTDRAKRWTLPRPVPRSA